MDFPDMIRLRQTFDRTMVTDIPGAVQAELKKLALGQRVRPGQRIALTGGSRGVANIALILKSAADYLKSLGARPFIFPAMGSHGGATAEGQTAMLAHYHVTEAFTGAPILSSMETVEISKTQDGVPVFIDKNAFEADGIIVVNRIKPHTKFKAPIESGLMKMMAIGMGKQKGAEYYHKAAIQYTFPKIIVDVGREVLKKVPILCGLGLVENGYDQTAAIAAVLPDELEKKEKELLILAKRMMPRLPFTEIDLLIIDEMGKDISGTGIDPNVTGRNRDILGVFPHPVNVRRLFVRDLTPFSGGNATGIGLADLTTKRLVDKIDRLSTYMNCITGISLEKAAIPMHFETDRECIQVALGSVGLIPPRKSRIVRIKNTLQLDEVEVSEIYGGEIPSRPDLEILEGPRPMSFDVRGNLIPLVVHGADRKGDN
ncbi:MAG: [Fe-S]-binding protein [Syntrophobacterales bacterium CG_4_8_14_3_um_filter_58_8]|nr:MAG: [Fe-S]-binding protein [Syntrophobacterales bacterium CG03_land_8_20_14_0_80_58_14]PJC71530.1 MAG: [Fe-S]-binding protein [Syntrophobacterales bacterium CG_4_8_14_3_um_filter_58_8]